jgi:hypothetical protein
MLFTVCMPCYRTLTFGMDETIIIQALNHFEMTNPYIIQSDGTIGLKKIKIYKELFKVNQTALVSSINRNVTITTNSNGLCSRLILIKDNININDHFESSKCPTLVYAPTEVIQILLENLQLQINQEVYFLESSSLEVFETFEVNNIKTLMKLGMFANNGTFKPELAVEQKFILRRSNFQGVVLKAMTDREVPQIWFEEGYKSFAPYYSNNKTYEVTGLTQGMYYEVLKTLETLLNFTTRLYRREDGSWGSGKLQDDGSYIANGMLKDLEDGNADMIATSFGIVYPRNLFVDFLPPITYDIGALYIKNVENSQGLDLQAYVGPFSFVLWLVILVAASMFTAMIFLISVSTAGFKRDQLTFLLVSSRLWTCLMAYIGGKPGPSKLDTKQSYRFTIFLSLLTGSVVWISYRAFLTSELSIPIKVFPFDDFESLANTDYRLFLILRI